MKSIFLLSVFVGLMASGCSRKYPEESGRWVEFDRTKDDFSIEAVTMPCGHTEFRKKEGKVVFTMRLFMANDGTVRWNTTE